jgi:hypothetical protein
MYELFCIYLVIISIIFLIYYFILKKTKESFENAVNQNNNSHKPSQNKYDTKTINTNDYLYPTRDLQKICGEKGLAPSYGPKSCYKDGQFDAYSNCECQDKTTGECKSCYPKIKEDERSSSVIFQQAKFQILDQTYSHVS